VERRRISKRISLFKSSDRRVTREHGKYKELEKFLHLLQEEVRDATSAAEDRNIYV
jgi:hypothetical protein